MDFMPTVNMSEAPAPEVESEEEQPTSPKQQIKQEEIFKDFTGDTLETESPKQEKVRQKKKRPPMSEEHKEKLKQAREKALETRRRNAREKKELKELQKMKKQKELEELRAEVNGTKSQPKPPKVKEVIEEVEEYKPPPKPAPQPAPQPTGQYTKEDLLKAQQQAVLSYEKARQYKKRIKKEEEEKIKQNELHMAKAIRRNTPSFNTNPRYGDDDYWDNCF